MLRRIEMGISKGLATFALTGAFVTAVLLVAVGPVAAADDYPCTPQTSTRTCPMPAR
jgi:hypothetical protein